MSVNDTSSQGSSRSRGGATSSGVSREEFERIFTAIGDIKGQLDSVKRDMAQDREEEARQTLRMALHGDEAETRRSTLDF